MDGRRYESLYARYINDERTEQMLDLANVCRNTFVIDLCGGTGRLTAFALKRKAEVLYVDRDSHMWSPPSLSLTDYKLTRVTTDVEHLINTNGFAYLKFSDVSAILCQQAVNYWFLHTNLAILINNLLIGGKFVFNTFNTAPSYQPTVLEYNLNGKKYFEASYLMNNYTNNIQHIQCCEGMEPDINVFPWISPEVFIRKLEKLCKVEVIHKNKTDIYVCTKERDLTKEIKNYDFIPKRTF